MSTDTKIKTLIFNKLTQEQYDNTDKLPTEFYLTPDTSIDISEKGVANGVASLGSDGKVPQEQLPNISAAMPVVDLGQVTSASFEINKNYVASVSGSASFSLPTPADTTITNKITLNLNVLANSVISWGVNVNAALAEFTPGKYQIRLLWNNTSSAWSAEVLKETKTESNVKTFISFNGNYSDECGTVSLTLNNNPSYVQGPFENYQSLEVSRSDSPLTMSGDLTKWNFGLNPFKITCWVLNSSDAYFDIFSSSDSSTRINTMGGCYVNGVTLSPAATSFSISSWTFLEFGRGSDGIFRFFVNGVQKMQKDASTIEADFSNADRMFSGYGSASKAYMSDFVISAESVSQADYTRPTTPFVLSDSGVSDLHDNTKENISNKTSDYTSSDENTYPNSKALKDAVSYLENNLSTHNTDTNAHPDIRQFLETLQLVQWVDTLPETGESKYIYAVPREETDTDGKPIAALYLWDGERWNGAGAFSLNIDPATLATKTDLTNYLPLTGGTLTGQFFTNSYISFKTNARGLIFPGSGQITGFNNGNIFIQNANNGLIVRKSDNQLVRRRNDVDSILLTEAEKSVANGVASLDANAKVPSEQIPVATASALGGIKVEFDETTGTLNIKTE